MSHVVRKRKKLTTKRKINNKSQQDSEINTSIFDSFVSVRSPKKQKNVSKLNEHSSISTVNQESEEVHVKLSEKSGCLDEDNIFLQTTMSPQNNIFTEETKTDISILDSSPNSKPEELYMPDKSSLLFKSEPKEDFEKFEDSPLRKDTCKLMNEDASFDDIIPIPDELGDPKVNLVVTNLPNEIDSECDDRNQCPVCLKAVGVAKYLSHVKSCATKNKLSTQQLLSAIELHKKQLAERKELGLGVPVQSYRARVSPKRPRTHGKKGPVDSSLQLALALSASLHSALEVEVIQEAEALKEAGLSKEAEQKLCTLEKYGFASDFPVQPVSMAGGSKSRPLPSSLLLRRTQEDRDRIVTEKVAIILINEEVSVDFSSFTHLEPNLKSKVLKENWNSGCHLWTKSRCPEDEKREAFYVTTLAQFVSPSRADVGEGMRRLSQLPGRMNTPVKEKIDHLETPSKLFKDEDEIDTSDLPTPLHTSFTSRVKKYNSSYQCKSNHNTSSSLNSLAEDWGKLVNNEMLSDIKIRCKDCMTIPAHKLVFYVRCPRVLDEVLKEGNDECILNWESVSANSVLAFIEYVYCSRTDKILMLDVNDIISVKTIAERLEYTELKGQLSEIRMSATKPKKTDIKQNLFKLDHQKKACSSIADCVGADDQNCKSDSYLYEQGSGNNFVESPQKTPVGSSRESINGGRESPDFFADSDITTNVEDSLQERDELDILVSFMGKPTQHNADSNNTSNVMEQDKCMLIESPIGSSSSEVFNGKRKASNTSFSEDEDVSLSKKHCSTDSSSESYENKNHFRSQTCYASRKRNSPGKEELDEINPKIISEGSVKIFPENSKHENKCEEETLDLTQSSKSSDDEDCEYTKRESNKSSYESDRNGSEDDLTQKVFDEYVCKDVNKQKMNNCMNEPDEVSVVDLTQDNHNELITKLKLNNSLQYLDDSLANLTQKHNDGSILKVTPTSSKSNKDSIDPLSDAFHHDDYNDDVNMNTPNKLLVKSVTDDSIEVTRTLSTPKIGHPESINNSKSISSDENAQYTIFAHSSSNISLEAHGSIPLRSNCSRDYIDPVWDGYDDYYQFVCGNNTPLQTRIRHNEDKSLNRSTPCLSGLEKFQSKQLSLSPEIDLAYTPSINKSPKLSQATTSPSSRSSKSIKCISSDSKSPKLISQKMLTPSSPASIKCVSSDSKSSKHLLPSLVDSGSPTTASSSKLTSHCLSGNDSDIEVIPRRNSSRHSDSQQHEISKSRKNLTFQFETDSSSSKRICSGKDFRKSGENPASMSLIDKNIFTKEVGKTSLGKDSLAAMQRLLDDSFEVNDSLFDTADELAAGKNKVESSKQAQSSSEAESGAVTAGTSGSKSSLATPSPGIIVSDKVTPLPDYSGMKTPSLKMELSRFGLKPSLGRRKAKLLLRYIYDQTHPVVPDPEGKVDKFRQPENRPPKSPRKAHCNVVSPWKSKSPVHSPRKPVTVNLDDSESEADEPCSQMSTSSSISSSASLPEESFHQPEDILTEDLSDKGDMRSAIRSLITGDRKLHRKVLLYDPIYLEDLIARLKADGIKCKANDVMDFLDEQCITFRTNGWKATNDKRKQRQKSPIKKKSQTAGPSVSPSKDPVIKKRGRPKKIHN